MKTITTIHTHRDKTNTLIAILAAANISFTRSVIGSLRSLSIITSTEEQERFVTAAIELTGNKIDSIISN